MATITITPGWAGPASAVGTNPIVVQVAGVGPPGAAGTSGVAPSGTGIVTVTSGTLNTPAALTGDVTTTAGGLATTLATVNSNVGTFTNASVTVNAKGLVTAASSGAAGGITIGDTVTSGTSGRVLYVGAGPVLAQDAGLTYDPATGTMTTGAVVAGSGTTLTSPVLIGAILRGDGGAAYQTTYSDSAGNSQSIFTSATNDMVFTSNTRIAFKLHTGGQYRIALVDTSLYQGSPNWMGWSDTTNAAGGAGNTGFERAAQRVIGLTNEGLSTGCTLRSLPLTPSQITANQNNYAPGVARYYRLSTDASRDITGLSCSQVSGQECEIWNVGSNNIVLKHQDANSTAANRFICTGAADITLAADEIALLRYDSTTSRWRVRKI